MRLTTATVALAVLAASCAGAQQPSAGSETTATVVVPAVPVEPSAPAEPDEATSTVPATTVVDTDAISIGAWDWGPPCRVPVSETLSSSADAPSVDRTYVIDVVADAAGDGYVVSFDDIVVVADGLTEQQAAIVLLDNNAYLPTMRLDVAGRFVEFIDLPDEVARTLAPIGDAVLPNQVATIAASPGTHEEIRFNTVDSWYGYWADLTRVPARSMLPESEPGLRHLAFAPYETEFFVRGNLVMSRPGVPGAPPPGSVELSWYERADESVLEAVRMLGLEGIDQVEGARYSSSVDATVDPTNLRPIRVNRTNSMYLFGSGWTQDVVDNLVLSTFDWDAAEGCDGPAVAALRRPPALEPSIGT